jgi:hypothetical protein
LYDASSPGSATVAFTIRMSCWSLVSCGDSVRYQSDDVASIALSSEIPAGDTLQAEAHLPAKPLDLGGDEPGEPRVPALGAELRLALAKRHQVLPFLVERRDLSHSRFCAPERLQSISHRLRRRRGDVHVQSSQLSDGPVLV